MSFLSVVRHAQAAFRGTYQIIWHGTRNHENTCSKEQAESNFPAKSALAPRGNIPSRSEGRQ